MAKPSNQKITFTQTTKKRTSIGDSKASRSKHKRADRKLSRGQGHP